MRQILHILSVITVLFALAVFFHISQGAPGHSPGALDIGLDFDGADDYVEVPEGTNMDLPLGGTMEVWFKTRLANDWVFIAGKSGVDDKKQPWSVYVEDDASFRVTFYKGDGVNYDFVTSNGGTYEADKYNHLLVTWDKISGTQMEVHIYMNGAEAVYEDGNIIDAVTLGYTNDLPLNIGVAYTPESPIKWYWFNGFMHDVRLYSRVLSATEATEHYNGTYTDESGLVGKWLFDEGQGTAVGDTSGLGNNGVIYGAEWAPGSLPPAAPSPAPFVAPLPTSFAPVVEELSPAGGETFSQKVTISYRVTDQNDTAGPAYYALGETPVTLFYSSNRGANWNLLAKDLPKEGSYSWDISNLPEGSSYQVQLQAKDKDKKTAEKTSASFSIDRSAPAFKVSVEPAFSKGENVNITITATEPLGEAPRVTVTQRNYLDVRLSLTGSEAVWKGEYQVKTGYDGTATIRVVGRDKAGNTGDVIQEGGLFNIGIKPPPTPIVLSPLDNSLVYDSSVTVEGRIRRDTKAVLFLNNNKVDEVKPDSDGDFIFKDVALSQTVANGVNILQVRSEDAGGNLSEGAVVRVKFNADPVVDIIRPRSGDIVQGETLIEFLADDPNGDILTFSLAVSADGGTTWQDIARDLRTTSYLWNTRSTAEGAYSLRIIIDDGFAKTAAFSSQFSVKNFRPTVSFKNAKTIISANDATIDDGVAESGLRRIVDVEYSLDNGLSWLNATAKDGSFNSAKEEFSFELQGFAEGVYTILARARDDRGFEGETTKTFIVDFGPPPAPTIASPRIGDVFGLREDTNPALAGVQVALRGRAEKDNILFAEVEGTQFEGTSDSAGNFSLEVTLPKHGINRATLYAVDPAGNRSETDAQLQVVRNNPPDLRFLRPREGGGVSGVYEVSFEIQDRDLDTIEGASLSYRRLPDRTAIPIVSDIRTSTFSWDVSGLAQGFYELILEASDGVSRNTVARSFVVDNTPPTVSFTPLQETSFSSLFTLEMEGNARDNFSGIKYVEYSIDGQSWFTALIAQGYQERSAIFRLKHPFELKDGTYRLRFRASDVAGNVSGVVEGQEIVIDTTPPRVGSHTLSVGSFILLPEGDVFKIITGAQAKLRLSLEEDTRFATLHLRNAQETQDVEFIKKEGLWEADLPLGDTGGEYSLSVSAEDNFGNRTEDRTIGAVRSVRGGRVMSQAAPSRAAQNGENAQDGIADVKIAVFAFREDDRSWTQWQADAYGLENPIFSNEDGRYALFLPSGRYRLLLQKGGFQRLQSSAFDVVNPQFITFDLFMKPRGGVRGFFEDLIEKIPFLNF